MKYCSVYQCENPEEARFCLRCGAPFSVLAAVPETPALSEEELRADRKAIAAFVLSLCGLLFCGAFPFSLVALSLSLGREVIPHRSMRTAARILSGAGLVLSTLVWVLVFAFRGEWMPELLQ